MNGLSSACAWLSLAEKIASVSEPGWGGEGEIVSATAGGADPVSQQYQSLATPLPTL